MISDIAFHIRPEWSYTKKVDTIMYCML